MKILHIDDNSHKALKLLAVEKAISMTNLFAQILEEYKNLHRLRWEEDKSAKQSKAS